MNRSSKIEFRRSPESNIDRARQILQRLQRRRNNEDDEIYSLSSNTESRGWARTSIDQLEISSLDGNGWSEDEDDEYFMPLINAGDETGQAWRRIDARRDMNDHGSRADKLIDPRNVSLLGNRHAINYLKDGDEGLDSALQLPLQHLQIKEQKFRKQQQHQKQQQSPKQVQEGLDQHHREREKQDFLHMQEQKNEGGQQQEQQEQQEQEALRGPNRNGGAHCR